MSSKVLGLSKLKIFFKNGSMAYLKMTKVSSKLYHVKTVYNENRSVEKYRLKTVFEFAFYKYNKSIIVDDQRLINYL